MSRVSSIAQAIHASNAVTAQGVQATLRLPAKTGPDSPQEVATAIAWVLKKFFNIPLNPDQIMEIEYSERASFSIPSERGLPCRRVLVDFSATPPVLEIRGEPAVHGTNGYSALAFPWQKRSGTINEDGTIDWKKINSVPNIEHGALIATIYDKTDGSYGIDCFGKPLRPDPGRRQQVRWTKENIYRDNDEPTAPSFNLIAKKSGVIVYHLEVKDDPATLSQVSISENLKITGDIDYSLGDLETAASLEIIGSVRGNFSLISEGFIHVSDCIEGKEICAQRVKADLITNRCLVKAKEEVETGSITNAEASGATIVVKKNAAQAVLSASDKVVFEKNAAITNITVSAITLTCLGNAFSGRSTVILGERLFQAVRRILPEFEHLESERTEASGKAKEAATEILNQLGQLEHYGIIQKSTILHNLCLALKQNFVRSFQTVQAIDQETLTQAALFKEKVEEKVFEYSISKKIEKLHEALRDYNRALAILSNGAEEYADLRKEAELLSDRIGKGLLATLHEPRVGGKNASVRILCGEAELTLQEHDLSGATKKVRYLPPREGGLAAIHKGRLEIC
ncbi:flagellar assembly protein A [Thiovibrio sp. JS02]